ncbi:MAG: hypothetical protein MO852_09870 [Candidatus Devosia euplotis]|nr:hypothetical protein [Candidatus Devosia euplotis]
MALDKLGVLIALVALAGSTLPLSLFRANRIVPGETVALLALTPLAGFMVALLRFLTIVKLLGGFLVLAVLFILMGQSAVFLTPQGDGFARVSPGAGF